MREESAFDYSRLGRLVWLGTDVPYGKALALQRRLALQRAEEEAPDTLLLLEHAPVYTVGRRWQEEHVRRDLTAPLVETDRGGQVTYHGPGQLVGYPILDLANHGLGPRAYVRALETALVRALGSHGIPAHTEDGLTGVWTAYGKIAAIGVKISRGVTMHGFALNVSIDLAAFDDIVPCGIHDRPVTSMVRELRFSPDPQAVRETVASCLGGVLGLQWTFTVLE